VQPALGDPAWAGGWTGWPTEVPSNPEHSVILWFCDRLQRLHLISHFGGPLRPLLLSFSEPETCLLGPSPSPFVPQAPSCCRPRQDWFLIPLSVTAWVLEARRVCPQVAGSFQASRVSRLIDAFIITRRCTKLKVEILVFLCVNFNPVGKYGSDQKPEGISLLLVGRAESRSAFWSCNHALWHNTRKTRLSPACCELSSRITGRGDSVSRLLLLLLLLLEVRDFLPASPSPAQTSALALRCLPLPPALVCASRRFLTPGEAVGAALLCPHRCELGVVSPLRAGGAGFWHSQRSDIFLWFFRNPIASQQPLPKKCFLSWAARFADGGCEGTAKGTGGKQAVWV